MSPYLARSWSQGTHLLRPPLPLQVRDEGLDATVRKSPGPGRVQSAETLRGTLMAMGWAALLRPQHCGTKLVLTQVGVRIGGSESLPELA